MIGEALCRCGLVFFHSGPRRGPVSTDVFRLRFARGTRSGRVFVLKRAEPGTVHPVVCLEQPALTSD